MAKGLVRHAPLRVRAKLSGGFPAGCIAGFSGSAGWILRFWVSRVQAFPWSRSLHIPTRPPTRKIEVSCSDGRLHLFQPTCRCQGGYPRTLHPRKVSILLRVWGLKRRFMEESCSLGTRPSPGRPRFPSAGHACGVEFSCSGMLCLLAGFEVCARFAGGRGTSATSAHVLDPSRTRPIHGQSSSDSERHCDRQVGLRVQV